MGKLKVLSLFSGIGAFEKALHNLGIDYELVAFSEIDKYAIKSFCAIHNVDESLNIGDISKVDKFKLPDFDLLVGGSPCQAFSVAGQRRGFEDTRGTLFFEYVDTLKYKQPKFFVFENVKGLINHDKGKTLDIIAQSFSEVGYRIDMELLNSKYFDVPQNRERIYIIGVREDLIEQQEWIIPKERKDVMAKGKRRLMKLGIKMFNYDWPPQTEVTTRLRDILEDNVDERYYLSEEKTAKLVAQLEKTMGETPKDFKDGEVLQRSMSGVHKKDIYGTLRAGASRTEFGVIEPQPEMLGLLDMKGQENIRRVYGINGVSPTLTTMGGGHREPKVAIEQFTQGDGVACCIDANYTKGMGPSAINKGKRTHVVEEVRPILTPDREEKRQNGRRFKEDGEPMFTLTAQDRHGIAIRESLEREIREIVAKTRPNEKIEISFKENGDIRPHRCDAKKSGISELNINHENNPSFTVTSSHAPKIYGEITRYRIRKLTPLECWRLQAFSDEDFYKAKAAGISDTQLYKQAGNSITVTVLEAIFKNLLHTY